MMATMHRRNTVLAWEREQWLPNKYYAPINVSPHPSHTGQGGNFPCLEWQTCHRGRDIESLKCACAIRIVRVCGVQCHASLARRVTLCPYSSTLFDRRYACSSLLCWSSTRGYFIKYVWRRKIVSLSAITNLGIHDDIHVLSNPLSLPMYAPCKREGFEFECCPVGEAIEF